MQKCNAIKVSKFTIIIKNHPHNGDMKYKQHFNETCRQTDNLTENYI